MFECPDYLKSIRANYLNPAYLYSYWLTIYFIIYALAYIISPKLLPLWVNPYPTIIIGTFVQLLIFIYGMKSMPLYFIIGVSIWKLSLLLLTIIILPVDWRLPTITFNIAILGLYFITMIYLYRINPIDLYSCIENNPAYYPATASDFLKVRFG